MIRSAAAFATGSVRKSVVAPTGCDRDFLPASAGWDVFSGGTGRDIVARYFHGAGTGAYRAMSFGTPFVGVGNGRSDVPQRAAWCGSARSGHRAECGRGAGRFSAGKRFRFRFGVGWGNRTRRRRCVRPVSDLRPCATAPLARSGSLPDALGLVRRSADRPPADSAGGFVHRVGTSATGRARKRFRTRSSEKNRPRRKPFLRGRDVVSGPDLGPDGGF